MNFSFEETKIPGAIVIHPFYAEDFRGNFTKSYEISAYEKQNVSFHCDEDFIIRSEKNVIRGMHFQLWHPQAKLITVISGRIYAVILDLREESPAFGQWIGVYLSEQSMQSLYVPRGCAYGSLTLGSSVIICRCDGKYDKATDSGILYCDPDIGIEWPVADSDRVIVGARDRQLMTLEDFKYNCKFTY